jgi:hypothetical protein
MNSRMRLGFGCFVLAFVALVWPVHALAAGGASVDARHGGTFTFSDVRRESCPAGWVIGYVPKRAPAVPAANSSVLPSLNDTWTANNCEIARNNRYQLVVLLLAVGAALSISGLRRRQAVEARAVNWTVAPA